MPEDVGWGGMYQPQVVSPGALAELRDLAGPAPAEGKKWYMVNLFSGECKWYQSARRKGGFRSRRKKE